MTTMRWGRGAALLVVGLASATTSVPALAGPVWAVAQDLLPLDGGKCGGFGSSVAVSGDTIVVGDPNYATLAGVVYVFTKSSTGWVLDTEVKGPAASGNFSFGATYGYGSSVAVSGDTAFVGAAGENGTVGAVHVLTRSSAGWAETQVLSPPGAAVQGFFGTAVAIDGTTALVSAPNQQPSTVYVYVLSGATWTLQATLQDNATEDNLGQALALSGDTAIATAPGAGPASVFVRSGTTWTVQQTLAPPGGALTYDGTVALDGDMAVVSSTRSSSFIDVYTRSGTTWTQVDQLNPSQQYVSLARPVALGGGTIFAGGSIAGSGWNWTYVFAPAGPHTLLAQTLDVSGSSVATDGTTPVVGVPCGANPYAVVHVLGLFSADGDACTSDFACATGLCRDGVCCTVAACPGAGPCNAAEHCQAGTGTCSNTPINTGMSCSADACSTNPTCQNGACIGTPVACPAPDACHEAGACDPMTGQCSSGTQKPNGAACPGGTCEAGVCTPSASSSSGSSSGSMPPGRSQQGGCGCTVVGSPAGGAAGAGVALLLAGWRRRGARARKVRG